MKVLYLTANPNRASSTVPTEGWFRWLRPKGLEPVLVSNQAGAFDTWAKQQGIPSYGIALPFPSKLKPWKFIDSFRRLCGVMRRHDIQLIHCNEQSVYPIGQYLARWCKVPIAASIHSSMSPGFFRWIFAGRRRPSRVFFISKASRELCRPGVAANVPESAWRILYNGVDLERLRPDAEKRDAFRRKHGLDDQVALGVACALRPGKQLEHLVEVGTRLQPGPWRIVLAGAAVAGELDYGDAFLKSAKERLGDRLLYLGHLDDLAEFYNGLDVLVNTSKEETCSISILEALASGCPVVGYPSSSVAEQVLPEGDEYPYRDRVNLLAAANARWLSDPTADGGEIVVQDRIDLLVAAVQIWCEQPDLRAAGRVGARRRAETDFDIRKISDQLWGEYQELVR